MADHLNFVINETDEWLFGLNTVYLIFALRVLWSGTLVGLWLIFWLEKHVLLGFLVVTFNTAWLQVRKVFEERLETETARPCVCTST